MTIKKHIWIIKLEEPKFFSKNFRYFRSHILAEILLKRGHKITFFTSNYDHYSAEKQITNKKIDNFQYINLNGKVSYHKSYFLKILNEFFSSLDFQRKQQAISKPDLVIISIPSIILAKKIAYYCLKNNIKYIVDCRDLHPDIFTKELSVIIKIIGYPLIIILKKYLTFVCNHATAFVGINKYFVQHLESYRSNKSKIPNQVFELSYKPFYKIKTKKKMIKNKYKIIFVGQINKVFFYSYKKFFCDYKYDPSFEFFIVGQGRFSDKLAKDISKKQNIFFLGNLNQKKIIKLFNYMTASILLVDNRTDYLNSLPNKFFEAIYYKLPIISFNKGLMKKTVKNYKIGFYSNNYNHLKKKLVNDNIFSNYLYNRQVFLKKFSYQKIYSRYAKFLESL